MGDTQKANDGPNVQSRVWERREKIARLYITGLTLREVALRMSMPISTVGRDMKIMRDKWIASAMHNYDAIKGRELAKLDHMEAELWVAWEASKKPAERTVSEKGGGVAGERTRARVERENQSGDAQYMMTILRVVERRCKILGIDAPTKIAPTDPEGGMLPPGGPVYSGYGHVVVELPHNGREIIDVTPPRPASAGN